MNGPRRLVVFVEGKGDVQAVPKLVARLLDDQNGHDVLFVDSEPFRVGQLGGIAKDDAAVWRQRLALAAATRKELAAVLLVLDGDPDFVHKTWTAYTAAHPSAQFCAATAALVLAEQAKAARGGENFSVAVVFAMKEFEAWLLAGVESLRGVALAEKRGVVPMTAAIASDFDPESRRDAKGLLTEQIPEYRQTLDQAVLAGAVSLSAIRDRCPSFRRLERAVDELIRAARQNQPVVSPAPRSPAASPRSH